jgi:hypothetical protein
MRDGPADRRATAVLAHSIVDASGRERRRLRVFCGRAGHSIDLDACRRCSAFVEVVEGDGQSGWVHCFPERTRLGPSETHAGSLVYGSPVCVHEDVRFSALRKLVVERELPFVLVVDASDHVAGTVWPRQLDGPSPRGACARDVMTKACTAAEACSIRDALLHMAMAHLRWLPIVAPDGTPVGMLRDVDALQVWARERASRP